MPSILNIKTLKKEVILLLPLLKSLSNSTRILISKRELSHNGISKCWHHLNKTRWPVMLWWWVTLRKFGIPRTVCWELMISKCILIEVLSNRCKSWKMKVRDYWYMISWILLQVRGRVVAHCMYQTTHHIRLLEFMLDLILVIHPITLQWLPKIFSWIIFSLK